MDASVVAAALLGQTRVDLWASEVLGGRRLSAPHLMPAEVCHVLRRQVARGVTSAEVATDAVTGLVELRAELHPFEPFAERIWELRDTVSAYDAWYVALAEALDAPLATLDERLARAPGPLCAFVLPQ